MADFLASKVAAEVVERRWTVPVDADDAPASVSLSASGVTVDANEFIGNELVLTLSAGTAGATGSITATVTTDQGRTLVETLYIPIIESAAQIADTARDYIDFALRKVTGFSAEADAEELAVALEHLNGLVAEMRAAGADIGAPFPLVSGSVIYCPDYAVSALRYNLLLRCLADYEAEPTAIQYELARRGMQLVKHKNLPDTRAAVYF
jgi:hypothetical protein